VSGTPARDRRPRCPCRSSSRNLAGPVPDADDLALAPPSPLKRLRFLIEHAFVAYVAWGVRLYPRRIALAWGTFFGTLAWLSMRADRRVAHANLDLVLGDSVSRRAKHRIVRQTFQRTGRMMTNLFWAPRQSPADHLAIADGDATWAALRELTNRGKGVVLVTPHYDDFEMLCRVVAAAGFPFLFVAEPVANPRVERLLTRLRAGTGNTPVPPKFALLKLLRGLRRGERAAVVCDVNGRRGRGGVWVDFFGRQVFNGVALAELALRTGSAVVFVTGRTTPGGRMTVTHRPPIEFAATGDHEADVRALTQRVVDYHAELLRTDPEPWLWTYKRWKRLPSPGATGYPFYARFARVR
jgi:KDO2-lipid IV(A) lauroyltransferase